MTPASPAVIHLETAAARIDGLLTGGSPPKWVASQAAAAFLRIADTAPGLAAAAARAAAGWVDDYLAWGSRPEWVAGQAAAAFRWIAGQERAGWPETTDGQPVVLGLVAYREAQTQTHEGAA